MTELTLRGAGPAADGVPPGSWRDPRRSNWWALAALAATVVSGLLVCLITVDRLKDAVIARVLHGGPVTHSVTPGLLLAALGPLDGLLAVLAVACLGVLAWTQARGRALSRLARTATPLQAFIALTIVTVWTGQAYLGRGILLGGDSGSHISRFLEVARGLREGALPTWTNYQYLGAPLLWFTGPLSYVLGGGVAWLTGDAVAAAKILLFGCHLATAWLMFALLRRLDFRAVPAMLASAGFAGCFACLHLFLYRGVFPQALTIVFLVVLFLAAEGLMRGRGPRWSNFTLFALATGGLLLNHQPHALFAAFYLALFGAACLAAARWRWPGLIPLVLAGACGVVISTVAVLPVLAESDWVMIEPDSALFGLRAPTLARLAQLIVWRDTRTTWGIDYWAYLGITLVALGAVGGWAGLSGRLGQQRRGLSLAAMGCIAVGLFLYNPVVRDILFLAFFLALLVAIGVEWLEIRHARWVPLAVALVLVDIGGTSVQPVTRTDKAFALDAGRALERMAPNERVLEIDSFGGAPTADIGPGSGPVSYAATVQRVAGNHNMAATHAHNYVVAAAKLAEADLRRDGALSDTTRRLLGLLNVGRIICLDSVAVGCPPGFAGTVTEAGLGADLRLAATPVVFARRLTVLDPPAGLDKPMLWPDDFSGAGPSPRVAAIDAFLRRFVAAETPVPAAAGGAPGIPATVAAIPVRALPRAMDAAGGDGPWSPRLTGYTVSLERVVIGIASDGAGYAQIAHPWFPATDVRVDGMLVTPLRGAIDLMVIPVHAGLNRVEITAGTTRVRELSEWLSLFGIAITIAGAAWLARADRAGSAAAG